MEQDDWSADRMRDRLQIQEVLYRYCRAIDRIQPDLLDSLFTPDALIFKSATPIPIAEFLPDFAFRHAKVPRSSHMVTSFLIEFTGEDRAFVESWGLAVEHVPGDPAVDHVYRVRYADLFHRHDGHWKIAERSYLIDHVMDVPVDPSLAPSSGAGIAGLRSDRDPAMVMRARLGLA